MRRLSVIGLVCLALGLAFLYLPIVFLVLGSFNAGRNVAVWTGWSTHWYAEALADPSLLDPAWVTLRVALLAATMATVLGTAAAVVLVNAGRFPGRLLFFAMISAPIVMPDVVLGLSVLLLFVALDIARGFWTIVVAHTTLAMCFVAVVVRARLVTFDRSLTEAAIDLGCPPFQAFMRITLPIIAPAVAAGWLLAFILSLDDVVIASFTTGPGATTLPMKIYSDVKLGVKPEINAICTIMIGLVTLAVLGASLLSNRVGRRGS